MRGPGRRSAPSPPTQQGPRWTRRLTLFLAHRFVEVQHHATDHGKGGKLRWGDARRKIFWDFRFAGADLIGIEPAVGEAFSFLLEQAQKFLLFDRIRWA